MAVFNPPDRVDYLILSDRIHLENLFQFSQFFLLFHLISFREKKREKRKKLLISKSLKRFSLARRQGLEKTSATTSGRLPERGIGRFGPNSLEIITGRPLWQKDELDRTEEGDQKEISSPRNCGKVQFPRTKKKKDCKFLFFFAQNTGNDVDVSRINCLLSICTCEQIFSILSTV